MKLFWDKGTYCTDTFLLPQSWNSFRQIQPFISLLLLLCLWVINAKAHCGDTNVCISFLHMCSSARGHQQVYCFLIHNVLFIWLCFPINPLWWCPDSLNLIWWDVKTRLLAHHDVSTHLWDACIWQGGAPFNRCCVALEGIRPIKSAIKTLTCHGWLLGGHYVYFTVQSRLRLVTMSNAD